VPEQTPCLATSDGLLEEEYLYRCGIVPGLEFGGSETVGVFWESFPHEECDSYVPTS
jgi:hypothetical protein